MAVEKPRTATTNSHRTGAPPGCPAAVLFREAVVALDRRLNGARRDDFTGRADSLRRSVLCMVDAFLAARGKPAASDADRSRLAAEHPILDRASDSILLEILSLDTRSQWTAERFTRLRELEGQYRAMLPALRSSLAAELPDHEPVPAYLKRVAGGPAGRVATVMAAVVALIAGAYYLTGPAYRLDLGGQVFWKQSPGEPFAEERSRTFDVQVDGRLHEYAIDFETPVQVSVLRLDPVDRMDATAVDVHHIGLLGSDGEELLMIDDYASWSCMNCRWLTGRGDGSRLRPLNDDPYVFGPAIAPLEVAGIVIGMRASADKTIWEWITRLEKSLE